MTNIFHPSFNALFTIFWACRILLFVSIPALALILIWAWPRNHNAEVRKQVKKLFDDCEKTRREEELARQREAQEREQARLAKAHEEEQKGRAQTAQTEIERKTREFVDLFGFYPIGLKKKATRDSRRDELIMRFSMLGSELHKIAASKRSDRLVEYDKLSRKYMRMLELVDCFAPRLKVPHWVKIMEKVKQLYAPQIEDPAPKPGAAEPPKEPKKI